MGYTKFNFKVPQLNNYFVQKGGIDYSKKNIIDSHKKMINDVEKNYGKLIDKWSKIFQIDKGIVICFICTESGGKNAPRNRFNATGLMQVTPNTVYETITKWDLMVDVPLSTSTLNFFNKKVSTTSKWSRTRNPNEAETQQIQSTLNDVEYNIAVGVATLRWLVEAFDKIGVSTLDKVMVSYNAGFYGTRNKIKSMTIKQIVVDKSLPSESRSYVLKMLGVHGFMDLYYNVMKK